SYFSGVAAGMAALVLLLYPALLLTGEGDPLALLGSTVLMAAFCSVFCSLCCLAAEDAAGCGVASFGVSVLSLALAGGIVPPVLLPAPTQELIWLSPVTWLARLAAWPMGFGLPVSAWACPLLSGLGMAALALELYRRRLDRQEVAL
ncbi:MAG: hypothetical protein K2P16_07515, partial [Lawsonibacter sp.]|nr:hypothetical protein [Lawsonibacter sp.]